MGAQENAQAQVALKYDPQQAAIDRQIQAIKDQTASNEAGINQFGTTGRQNINTVYDTLSSLLGANRQQSASDLARQVSAIGQGYDVANQYQNAVADEGRQRLASWANALGAGAGGNLAVQTQLESTLANILGQNAAQKAGSMGNLQDWAGRWDAILGQGQNIGEQTRATKLSDFETQLLNMLGSNRVAGLEGQNEQYARMNDILSARGNDLVATYNQLAQQDWENAFRQAQLDQDAAKANAANSIDQQRLQLQAEGQAADNAYRSAALNKEGQLTTKDLINLAMQQQGNESDAAQQKFENDLALQKFYNDKYGNQTNPYDAGNQAYMQFASKLMGSDNYDPSSSGDLLQQYASLLNQSGMPNNAYDSYLGQLNAAAGAQNFFNKHTAMANMYPSSGSSSGGSSGGSGGGFSLNLGNGLQNLIRSFSLGQIR